MNRRKAIYSLLILSAGGALTYTGLKLYQVTKTANLSLLDANANLIAALTEIIIPRTNTPGAIDTGCPPVLISMIKKNADKKTQNNFIDGLMELKEYTFKNYQSSFEVLPFKTQQKIVQHFYEIGKNYAGNIGKVKNKFLGKSFFHILKEFTAIAYCSSKDGANIAMAYNYTPGKFEGCVPLKPGQKSWATK